MTRSASSNPAQPDTWTWPEERWRPIVEKVRAGRSLKPVIVAGRGALRGGPLLRFRP